MNNEVLSPVAIKDAQELPEEMLQTPPDLPPATAPEAGQAAEPAAPVPAPPPAPTTTRLGARASPRPVLLALSLTYDLSLSLWNFAGA